MYQCVIPGFEAAAQEYERLKALASVRADSQVSIIRSALEERGNQTASEIAASCRLTSKQIVRRLSEMSRSGTAQRVLDELGNPMRRRGLSN